MGKLSTYLYCTVFISVAYEEHLPTYPSILYCFYVVGLWLKSRCGDQVILTSGRKTWNAQEIPIAERGNGKL